MDRTRIGGTLAVAALLLAAACGGSKPGVHADIASEDRAVGTDTAGEVALDVGEDDPGQPGSDPGPETGPGDPGLDNGAADAGGDVGTAAAIARPGCQGELGCVPGTSPCYSVCGRLSAAEYRVMQSSGENYVLGGTVPTWAGDRTSRLGPTADGYSLRF